MKVLSLATEISYFVHSETYVLENFYQKTIRQKLVLLYVTHSGTATVVLSILTASPMTIYLFTFTNSDTCTSHCEHFPYNHIFRTQLNTGADPAFWFGRGTGRGSGGWKSLSGVQRKSHSGVWGEAIRSPNNVTS